ncbi:hypothetical protein A3H80_04905 [Candidatus Roizmanbacteria bacterium RIFCSPLOWO2_02_FULL_37_19]|uniref:Uncharacterized protein n=1 Tax=Candidatus Roizmanbacteria bacterium RIFCSPHIGHO2_02_FULL_37_24 TaxID=1802037 RepID=A0A1F7GVZ4_9BACT|nr:MAG: hypothetical protein A2862_04160 [Candidatus Roizmanbacteria bacterium RIFCSPHIGHO2_01_FULL_38_41]OGK22756.1 MAG: hypothetical protein A3C24_01645 [Candidatus Roizmanbacteria bacterium RIFCSPHIGHO2_02_FULL_37_24]OGK33524.1 MAG: hypothetical protein A3E10_03810 [Candidatus Roizmanbacteria bacterium RIFCSPHIGHO2_12_FULL_37_23]OGK44404.1 MAG: hypothetical protein A2956_03415 [Candidatus Roizmanbacteria bacterium RIFCSPLOWO2_01_FULL_37_57]OGK55063.1 MAG: hypothetical protein A3H80_04905 [Ca
MIAKTLLKKIFFGLVVVFYTLFLIVYATPVYAQRINSSGYTIIFPNVNFSAGNPSSAGYDLSTTVGQLAAKQFSSSGYIVKAGFQYLHSIIPFTFSISDISIDLGSLTPDTPSTATTTLTVTFGGAGQYQVTAVEVGPLTTLSGGDTIPDTSCNGGAQTCTESSAHVWTSSTAYGFGYNMSGNDIPADFVNSTYYRPFADSTAPENPVTVMSNSNITESSISTVTFKANVSNIQPAGSYQTVIKFVATPSF